jgi:dTDP-4-amino-4,6-dideoxygalactose transaminase
MPEWTVPLSDLRFTAAEVDAVAETYRRGWLSQGPTVAEFERAFADALGARHAIAVANGTAALHLICVAIGLRSGDEVVVPSLTFAATAAAVLHTGAVPVFADISPDSRPWISPHAVEPLITSHTKAVINVAYAGHPGEVRSLTELARARDLILIEDAAHALGGAAGRQPVGTFGQAAAFSFFANKNMPLGEGGMVVTDDDELDERIRLLRSHGMTADTWARHRGEATEYDVLVPGFNYRLDEARAALGLLLLRRLAEDNQHRSGLAARYAEALAGIRGVRAAVSEDRSVTNAWHVYPLLLDPQVNRSSFRDAMRTAGVQTSVHYPPLHLTNAFSGYCSRPLPATEEYARRTVTVPLFPYMTADQHAVVIEAIRSALE